MSKLFQKHLTRGWQEFEIVDDAVNMRFKPLFQKEEKLTVMLSVLNPEPLIDKSFLHFTSRVNNEPLLSLYLGKPNARQFNEFVSQIKQKAQQEYQAFAGLKPMSADQLNGNVYDEPPEFDDSKRSTAAPRKPVRAESIDESIHMLNEYAGGDDLGPLIAALEALRSEPENSGHFSTLASEFAALGPRQGAVLTYAPYIGVLMSDL